jgi:signal transduction histidine kinase
MATERIGMQSQTETAVKDAARIDVLVEALKKIVALHGLTDQEFAWLAEHGTERYEDAGVTLFEEDAPADTMTILLKGEIQVKRERGAAALFIGRAGQITGTMPFSRMKQYGGRGYTAAPTWALEFHRSMFQEMLRAIPSLGDRLVGVLLDRVREVTRLEQQAEKLVALGKLAGNLAHELNNPASAAQRSADGMLKELRFFIENSLKLGHLCLTEAQTSDVRAWHFDMMEEVERNGVPEATTVATREDAIMRWLQGREIGDDDGWKIAPELAELGVMPAQLDRLPSSVSSSTVSAVLLQITSGLRAEKMAEAMLDSTQRIFGLIRAIKDYSFMDQAPIQEVDVPQGIESTLVMLHSQAEHATIERVYAPDLPLISAYGSQLNQIWTALLENALEATQFKGHIVIKVRVNGNMLLVEFWDDGPGIPQELQARIFEPFFTTKGPGQGLGLGLDAASRVVRTHRGSLTVESKPGATCFQVRLPIEQVQQY